MLVNGKGKNCSRIIKTALFEVEDLEFIKAEENHINNYDMFVNISVIVPCQDDHLFVETVGLKQDFKMGFDLIGKASIVNISTYLDPYYDSKCVSVGELTRRNKTVIKFTELLRLAIPDSTLFSPISNLQNASLSYLDAICKIALNRYLCDRIFIDDPEYYKLGELDLY